MKVFKFNVCELDIFKILTTTMAADGQISLRSICPTRHPEGGNPCLASAIVVKIFIEVKRVIKTKVF